MMKMNRPHTALELIYEDYINGRVLRSAAQEATVSSCNNTRRTFPASMGNVPASAMKQERCSSADGNEYRLGGRTDGDEVLQDNTRQIQYNPNFDFAQYRRLGDEPYIVPQQELNASQDINENSNAYNRAVAYRDTPVKQTFSDIAKSVAMTPVVAKDLMFGNVSKIGSDKHFQNIDNLNAGNIVGSGADIASFELGARMIAPAAKYAIGKGKQLLNKGSYNLASDVSSINMNEMVGQGKSNIFPNTPTPISENSLMLKSLRRGNPLEKQLNKAGEININNLKGYINRQEVSKADKFIMNRVLNRYPNKNISYDKFKQQVGERLIPLETKTSSSYADYGLDRLGYNTNLSSVSDNIARRDAMLQQTDNYRALLNNPSKGIQADGTYGIPNYWTEGRDGIIGTEAEFISALKSNISKNEEMLRAINHDIAKLQKLTPTTGMNSTVQFSNPSKFGTGSNQHFDDYTLGHSRYFKQDNSNIYNNLERQSDYFQNRNTLTNLNSIKDRKGNALRLSKLHDKYWKDGNILRDIKASGAPLHEVNRLKGFRDASKKSYLDAKGSYNDIEQKIFLGESFEKRILQEDVNFAAKQGSTEYRTPTGETIAKIEGYTPRDLSDRITELKKMKISDNAIKVQLNSGKSGIFVKDGNKYTFRPINSVPSEWRASTKIEFDMVNADLAEDITKVMNKHGTYYKDHQFIIDKYQNQNKLIKKTFNIEPSIKLDKQGNSWYRFDIPKDYIEGKAEIVPFNKGGEINKGSITAEPKYNNIVEKQDYWDSMEGTYGKGVKHRQIYMDLYDKPIDDRVPNKPKTADDMYMLSNDVSLNPAMLNPNEESVVNFQQPKTTWRNLVESRDDIENRALLMSSIWDEGGDKFTVRDSIGYNIQGDTEFGLDTAGERRDDLITKGYLDADIADRTRKVVGNPEGRKMHSLDFDNLDDVISVKNAYFKEARDDINTYSNAMGYEFDEEAMDYFMLASYNSGRTGVKRMIDSYARDSILDNNEFLNDDSSVNYREVHRNVMRRIQSANMLRGEGIVTEQEEPVYVSPDTGDNEHLNDFEIK